MLQVKPFLTKATAKLVNNICDFKTKIIKGFFNLWALAQRMGNLVWYS